MWSIWKGSAVITATLLIVGCEGPNERDPSLYEGDGGTPTGETTITGGEGGGGAGTVCPPGTKRCDGTYIETCSQESVWELTKICQYVCNQGACTGVCTPNSKKCDNLVPQTCNVLGQWDNGSACPSICQNGECSGTCVPSTKKCDNLKAQTCDQEGKWSTTQNCPYVCDQGTCTGVCTPNSKKCDNLVPQTCNVLGQWDNGTACNYVCTTGNCTGACTPTDLECNGNVLEVCTAQGQWTTSANCPYVCRNDTCTGVCTPNTTKCDGNTIETCNAQGQWQSGSTCPFLCNQGVCTGICVPGTKQCNGTGYKECQPNGQWGSTLPCPGNVNADPTCTGNGVCGTTCQTGYKDCTTDPGCESDLSDPTTCGSCFNNCDGTNGTPTCSSGTCGITCNDGWNNCTADPGCETPLGTTANCTACGDTCNSAPANSRNICTPTGCDFECNATWGDCDGNPLNGCTNDVWNDPLNCGACNNFCYGNTCSNGTCSYNVEAVTESPAPIKAFTTDTTHIYWATSTGIYSVPKNGGAPTLITTTTGNVWSMVTNGTDIVFVDATDLKIKKIAVNGGPITILASGGPSIMILNGGNVYWSDGHPTLCCCSTPSPTKIYRVSLAGGPRETMATVTCGATHFLSVDDYKITFGLHGAWVPGTLYHNGSIAHTSKSKTNQIIDCNDGNIHWVYDDSAASHSIRLTGDIVRNSTHLFFYADLGPWGDYLARYVTSPAIGLNEDSINDRTKLSVDESNVYWRDYYYVKRISVNGGSAQILAKNQEDGPQNVELDNTHAYWATNTFKYDTTTYNRPAIMRIAK